MFNKVINGKVIFNTYYYSNTTSKHQSKIMGLLHDLGIDIDLRIEARRGLQDLETAIYDYEERKQMILNKIFAPRTHKKTNRKRGLEIISIQNKIDYIKQNLLNNNAA